MSANEVVDEPAVDELSSWRGRIDELRRAAEALASRLEESAREFGRSGGPPPEPLLDELRAYGRGFAEVRDALGRAAAASGFEARPGDEGAPSLDALAGLAEGLGRHLERLGRLRRRRRRAEAVLGRLRGLRRRDGGASPLVEASRARIEERLATLADGEVDPADDPAGSDDLDAFEALVRLARDRDALEMEESFELAGRANRVIDPQLVWAVAIGRVVLDAGPPDEPPPDGPSPGPPVEDGPTAEVAPPPEPEVPPAAEVAPAAGVTPAAVEAPALPAGAEGPTILEDEPGTSLLLGPEPGVPIVRGGAGDEPGPGPAEAAAGAEEAGPPPGGEGGAGAGEPGAQPREEESFDTVHDLGPEGAAAAPDVPTGTNPLRGPGRRQAQDGLATERAPERPGAGAAAAAPGLDFLDPASEGDGSDVLAWLEPLFDGRDRGHQLRDTAWRFGERLALGPVDLKDWLSPGQAKEARAALEEWCRMRPGAVELARSVRRVLGFLGFAVREVRPRPGATAGEAWFEFDAEPLAGRDACLLPDYGSRAEGRYQVVCLAGQPAAEEVLRVAAAGRGTRPLIAFYFGALTRRRRRELAHALRRRPVRRLLVLDDLLLTYLGLQARRLPAFVHAACQFGLAEPYAATPDVPPEMFYGRAAEAASLFARDGAHLVYGGRQLGKTALLEEIRRRRHDPEGGLIVEVIDLRQGEPLGLTRPPDDLWALVASRLRPYGVLPATARRADGVEGGIVRWLDEDRARRILLLLDEVDDLLEADAAARWPRVGRLEAIMGETGRRFKVVLCGLQRVLRASRDARSPLARLGAPIRVGPFRSEERREAAELVALPLQAMGYRPTADLVGQVLARSSFDPGLIQLACRHLLALLSDPDARAFDPATTPPYPIRPEDVEGAFADPGLLARARERLLATLDLDPRYRVIALGLAAESLADPAAAAAGFAPADVRRRAAADWPEGFGDSPTDDEFRDLLDEMWGLGVLRRRDGGGGRYALRGADVLGLLGDREQVVEALAAAVREPGRRAPAADPIPNTWSGEVVR